MDARLHQLQGKAEFVSDVLTLLQEFYRDKLAMLLRHQASAQAVTDYNVNNTYQYVINREETQLSWIASAIAGLGGTPEDAPFRGRETAGRDASARLIKEDADDAQAFVDRWKPRVDAMPNARHAKMLRLVLGEVLEAKRFFEQALAGRDDLLGRRSEALGPAFGEVLPSRWIE
jgi:hypothetical protein